MKAVERFDYYRSLAVRLSFIHQVDPKVLKNHLDVAIREVWNFTFNNNEYNPENYKNAVNQINSLCKIKIPESASDLLKE